MLFRCKMPSCVRNATWSAIAHTTPVWCAEAVLYSTSLACSVVSFRNSGQTWSPVGLSRCPRANSYCHSRSLTDPESEPIAHGNFLSWPRITKLIAWTMECLPGHKTGDRSAFRKFQAWHQVILEVEQIWESATFCFRKGQGISHCRSRV